MNPHQMQMRVFKSCFYYYMFYLRAKENDRNTTTPGIRKYYSQNQFEKLYQSDLLTNLRLLVSLWTVINNRIVVEGENWSEIKKFLKYWILYPLIRMNFGSIL